MKSLIIKSTVTLLFVVSYKANAQNGLSDTMRFQTVDILTQANQYKLDSGYAVGKMMLKDLDNPQVYNTISKKILADQVVTNLNDALKNATGVARLWESTGRSGDGAEYYSMRGFSVQPTMINGMPSLNNGSIDPANIESVDVIKGPSGALYGGAVISYGGLININTKQAFDRFSGDVGLVAGSYGLQRLTMDVNLPLSKKMFIRLNSSVHSQGSFQDAGFQKSVFVAPSVLFQANKRLTFYVNAEYKESQAANAPMIFFNRYAQLSFNDSNISEFDQIYTRSFTSNDLSIKNSHFMIQGKALYQISTNWKSQTIISSTQTQSNGYYHYLWDASNGGDFTRYISKAAGETQALGIQQNVNGQFKLGSIKNKMLIGLDYFQREVKNYGYAWVANGKVNVIKGTDSGILSAGYVDQLVNGRNPSISTVKTETRSAYVSDVIEIVPRLSFLGSLRLDHFSGQPTIWSTEKFSQTSLSHRLGFVYQPIKDQISLFGNYMNGFSQVDPAMVAEKDGSNPRLKIFKPEQANQYEFGVKTNWLNKRLATTISYYNIDVTNVVMPDPDNQNNSLQGGSIKSNGVEISLTGKISENLNVVAGYSINHAEVTNDDSFSGYLNMRPESAGPSQMGNVWLQYNFNQGVFSNWGLGIGGNYANRHKTLNRSNIGTYELPSYAIWNAAISYTGNGYSLVLKGDNLLNTKYYSGWSTITPQRLRTISIALNVRF